MQSLTRVRLKGVRLPGKVTMPGFSAVAICPYNSCGAIRGKRHKCGLRLGGDIGDHFRPWPNFGQCSCQSIFGAFGVITRLAA